MAEAELDEAEKRQQQRPLRRGMYVLPSLFTAGNIAAGFYAMRACVAPVGISGGSIMQRWRSGLP